MEVFNSGQEVLVSVAPPLDNITGAEISASIVKLTILNKDGEIILNETIINKDSNNLYSYLLSPAQTTILDKMDIRVCSFNFIKDNGASIKVVERFILEQSNFLTVLENSFMSYDEALLLANYTPDVDDFLNMDELSQKKSLVSAYEKISKLKYCLSDDGFDLDIIEDISQISTDEFYSLPLDFRKALKLAQIIQANYIISGNEAEERRRDGIISETIGEAKMFFNNRPPLKTPLCKAAMSVIARYYYKNTRIGRA